jgi:hypothetical protein
MESIYEALHHHPVLSVVQVVLTVWMLIDAYRRSADAIWFWVILLFQPLGAWIYLFAVKVKDFRTPQGLALWQGGPSLTELRYRADNVPTLANHLALARRLIQRREYDEAVPHLESAVKIEPEHGEVLYCLARCHVESGRPAEAVPLLERLLDKDPRWSNYVALELLIETRRQLGDRDGAVASCRELVRLAPTLRHQCLLAETLREAGQDAEARGVLDRALRENDFANGQVRWRNRRWARQARRLLREIDAASHA